MSHPIPWPAIHLANYAREIGKASPGLTKCAPIIESFPRSSPNDSNSIQRTSSTPHLQTRNYIPNDRALSSAPPLIQSNLRTQRGTLSGHPSTLEKKKKKKREPRIASRRVISHEASRSLASSVPIPRRRRSPEC